MRFVALVTLIAFSATAAGCAIHKQMPRPLSPEAVAEVQDALERRGAWLEYGYPGQPPLVAAVRQGSFQKGAGGRRSLILYTDEPAHAVPLEHARSLQVNNHWLGALEGLGIGFLSGVLLGALVYKAAMPACETPSDSCNGMDMRGTFFYATVIVGSSLGTGIGAAVGQRYIYTF
jgi:hypothetical protein